MAKQLVEMCTLFDLYSGMLTQRQRDIFDLYYNEDLSLAEIAENTGITRQAVRDAILHAEETLRDCDARLDLRERLYGNREEWAAVYEAAQRILAPGADIEGEVRLILRAAQAHLPAADDTQGEDHGI